MMENKRILSCFLLLMLAVFLYACNSKNNNIDNEPTDNEPLPIGISYRINEQQKNVGLYLDSPDEILSLEIVPEFICWFEGWHDKSGSNNKISLAGTSRLFLPFITWQPDNVDFNEIIEGKHDEYITGYFERLALYCPDNEIIIRFAHEMEMRPLYTEAWYTWQGLHYRTYIDAWKHIVDIGRKINPHIKWLWSPNRADEYSAAYYPGDDYVDYVGISANLPADLKGDYVDFEDYYTNKVGKKNLEKYEKRIIVSEVSYSDSLKKNEYLKSIFDFYKNDDSIVLVAFFNYDVSDTQQYMISDDDDYMKIFYEGLESLR